MAFDRVIKRTCDGCVVRFGIVDGNETIVFVKSGADGSYDGYNHKYEKMARRIHADRGYSVITADNPDMENPFALDEAVIRQYVKERGFADYAVRFVGHSDGAYQNLTTARQFPQTAKVLGINPSSPADFDRLLEKLAPLAQVEKVFVYGTEDDEYDNVPLLEDARVENLRILTVDGADHVFIGRLDEFVALIDLV